MIIKNVSNNTSNPLNNTLLVHEAEPRNTPRLQNGEVRDLIEPREPRDLPPRDPPPRYPNYNNQNNLNQNGLDPLLVLGELRMWDPWLNVQLPRFERTMPERSFICRTEPISKAGIELDKFKRRLIRAVARQLLVEKKPEEEVWSDLKKETGCDCKTLWMRMRSLTVKKLDRLFAADDSVKDIPKVARMSLTDWLLFDLVLVHQKVDVIGQDNPHKPLHDRKGDPKPLVELFELVKEFRIEGRCRDSLAVAWSAATLKYNSYGHQCSPMLLQLRWYQLKELTRDKFYNFWYAYRGTAKRLSLAEPHTPTPLQAAIATEYKDIVTKPFMEWEELIHMRMVTLPEEFERRMLDRAHRRVPVPNSSDDDLVVIEPQIETIDLRVESDNEDDTNESSEKTQSRPETPIKIKQEPIDMDMDIEETRVEEPKKSLYDVVLESTTIEQEHIDSIDELPEQHTTDDELGNEENLIKETIESSMKPQDSILPQITSVFGNVSDTLPDNNIVENTDNIPVLANTDENLVVNSEDETPIIATAINTNLDIVDNTPVLDSVENTPVLDDTATTNVVNEDENVGGSDVPVEELNTTLSNTQGIRPQHIEISDSDQDAEIERNNFESPVSPKENTEETSEIRMEDKSGSENNQDKAMDVDVKPNIETNPFIEHYKASLVNEDAVMSEDIGGNIDEDVKPDITMFTFGEISNDIDFVDDGIALMDDGIAYDDEDKHDDMNIGNVPKIDPKLLMCPIVYTTKIDEMGWFRSRAFDHIEGKQLIDAIMLTSKPKKIEARQEEAKEDSSEASADESSDDEVTDDQRVKLSSYLLQKPRSRSYNPIQLCKNPDFNTRLKRLTVGFFSYPRNRGLIKYCKPLTIDLSKAFESKLISGTLYLKSSDQDIKTEVVDDTETRQNVTVVPSAMPAQSLMNSRLDDILPLLSSSDVSSKSSSEFSSTCERSKVINLPDISEIRRINQRLLTAEVTPIQVQNNRPLVPVSIVSSTQTVTAQSVEAARTDARGPSAIVDVTKDSPPKKNTESNSFTNSNNPHTFETHKPARRNLMDCSFSGHKKRNYRKVGPVLSWKPRQMRPDIPWLSKNTEPFTLSNKVEETLLTLDTLNKMLYLLTNDNENQPKSKQKKKTRTKKQDKPKTPDKEVKSASETQDHQTEPTPKIGIPKFNIRSADNSLPKKQKQTGPKTVEENAIALDDQPESDAEQSEKSQDKQDDKKKDIKYCCWARQRMLQMLFARKHIPTHPCPYPLCSCCCRTLLEQYIVNDHKIKKAKLKDQHGAATVDENVAAESSEKVVVDQAEVLEDTAKQNVIVCSQEEGVSEDTSIVETVPAEPPALVVEEVKDTTTLTENESINVEAMKSQDVVPSLGGEVSVTTTPVDLPVVNTPQPFKTPDIPINISINITGPKITTITHSHAPRKRRVNIPRPLTSSQAVKASLPTLRHAIAVNQAAVSQSLRNPIPPPRTYKPISPPKNLKEKMIYLNSKQISENPAENPIFLGKNKILLTTVKFPPNLKKFEEVKQTLKLSLKIPKGVQLMCLPNGSVTYTIDHNVEVNATDLALMPAIIAQIHDEMKKMDLPEAELPKAVDENEVVNLIDDDDDDQPKDNNNKNVETSEAEVPAIEVDEQESTTNSLSDGPQVETVENPDNIENVTDNTQTNIQDANPNMDTDQNAVPIQDVQELTETEPKTPEKDQPAASSTEVSEETRSESTTINKTKNILSDLMEMSGIFEEDITPTPEETLPEEVTEQQVVTENTPQLPEAQPDNPTPPSKQFTIPISKLRNQNNLPSTIKSPLGELSPITSLYELKYACLNNGLFFKLDFDTGYLIPINVCMKQQPKAIPKPINTESVIDLTEDESDKTELTPSFSVKVPDKRSLLIVNNVSSEHKSPSKPNPVGQQAATSISPVKPLKLFRASQPPILLRRLHKTIPLAIKKVSGNETTIENADHKVNKKQSISTVEMIDTSDNAMAKQLVPQLYLRKKRKIDKVTIVIHKNKDENVTAAPLTELPKTLTESNLEADDSSDEEPLANLAKRKRENEQVHKQNEKRVDLQPTNQNVVQYDTQTEVLSDNRPEVPSDQQSEVQSDRENEVEIDLQSANAEDVYMSDEPPESQSNYELILEKNMTDEAEDEQCILGV